MSPAQGIVGTTVTLTGTNFGTGGTAVFNDASITPSLWSNTSIVFHIPSGAQSGAITLSTVTGDTSSPIFVVLNDRSTVDVYGYALTYAANGNVLSVADEVNGNWSYSYDNLNRLYAAVPGAGAASGYAGHSLCMYYDDFGNRTEAQWQTAACSAPPAAGQPAPNPSATYNAANQVTNNFYQYDASGDVIYDGANYYAYDNEGRLCAMQTSITGSAVATGYLYDAEGRRVAKGSITASTSTPLPSSMCNAATNGFTVTESYVLGQAGEQLTTYTWSGSQSTSVATWARTNVYGDGELLATYDAVGAGLHFHLTDPLGTRRVQTDAAGTPETDCQSLPYGDGLNCFAAPGAAATGASGDDATPLHFTGKQRDTESGNDYFGARYYASSMGRFMSPDWAAKEQPVPYATFDDPQSLNLYSYVRNNPLSRADKDGHCDFCSWLITTVSTYVAGHPEVGQALQKLGDSVGIKLSAGVGRKVTIGGVKLGVAASVSSEARVDGTGSSKVQVTGAASVNGVGVQANGTGTFEKNGSFENPLDNLGGNAKLTGSGSHGDNINSNVAVGTDDRVGVGVGVNVGVAQAGVQVTAGTQEVQGVAGAVVNSAVQDTKQYVQDLHTSTTCGVGGCATPH